MKLIDDSIFENTYEKIDRLKRERLLIEGRIEHLQNQLKINIAECNELEAVLTGNQIRIGDYY